MATAIQNAYKDATLTFTDDKITWHCPVTNDTREVMMDWEQPIMAKMAELTVSEGDHVLECGFGMGILSDAIQARNPASHTICEFHPQVIEKAKTWASGKSNVTIHEDKWWSLFGETGRYDAILMDTYADDDLHAKFRQFCVAKIAKGGGKISWWNFSGGDSDEYMKFYWEDGIEFTDVSVSPPTNTYYNRSVYKVPVKTLTPPATGRGIISDANITMWHGGIKDILSVHNHYITTCADPSDSTFVNQQSGRSISIQGKGIYNINNGLLKVTGNHPMIIKRSGSWIEKNMNELVVGDKLFKKDRTEVEITQIDFDSSETVYTFARVLIDHNYFANNILMKGGSDA